MAGEIEKLIEEQIATWVENNIDKVAELLEANKSKGSQTQKTNRPPSTQGTGVKGAGKDIVGVENQKPIKRKSGGA